jgi:hypothetical protein
MLRPVLALTLAPILLACGGATPPPPSAGDSPHSAPPDHPALATAAPAPTQEATASAQAPLVDTYDDPEDARDPATLTPLFDKAKSPPFPKATTGDHECWQTVALSGDAKKDYQALVGQCGAATGCSEYTKPSVGKLHHVKDKRDTFVVRVQAGLCYRFFGVADASIPDLDILIMRANGDLVGEDRTRGPVAIIDSDKAWCMDRDDDLKFHVQIDGQGTGNYVFGVWARPRK